MRKFSLIALILSAVCLAALPLWGQTGMTTGGSSNRPIFVKGTVALASGGKLPQKAKIEMVCQADVQSEGWTDTEGGFNVQLGMNRFEGNSDASATSKSLSGGMGGALASSGAPSGSGASGSRQVDGASVQALAGCFIRATLTGYRSDTYGLDRVTVGEPTDTGTLLLHDLTKSAEAVVSSTSLAAPKDAKKSFDKARDEVTKRDFTNAEADFKKAVQAYPKYAEAWQEMGDFLVSRSRGAEAKTAFQQAISADAKFPKPYLSLARIELVEKDWKTALDNSEVVIAMNGSGYPQAYYFDAVAAYNLGDRDKALDRAQHAVKIDTEFEFPIAWQLVGVIYDGRGDFKSAAAAFRSYVAHAPAGPAVDAVRKMAEQDEARAAQAAGK